jgi:hypothetical protein
MRRLPIIFAALVMQLLLPDAGASQGIDSETRNIIATAARAVLEPDVSGRVLISITVHSVSDEHTASALSTELGATAIAREAAFTCATFPQTQKIDKRTCRLDGGQLIEVRAVERNGSSARVTVRIVTNGGRPLFARLDRVELERTDGTAWRVSGKFLLEIT